MTRSMKLPATAGAGLALLLVVTGCGADPAPPPQPHAGRGMAAPAPPMQEAQAQGDAPAVASQTVPLLISVQEARQTSQAGTALIVCAYEAEDACAKARLQGALTLQELQAKEPSLPKDTPLLFYCG